MPFAYEAVDGSGHAVSAVIEADSSEAAMDELHARGLFVTQVREVADDASGKPLDRARSVLGGRAGNTRDRMLLTQQMAMMLRAGGQVVPSLKALLSQIDKPAWREIVEDVCHQVEDGASLSEAMSEYPGIFDDTFRTIIAAGESTGATADAFHRLSIMTKKQQEVKVRVISAMIYPILLLCLCLGVVGVLMFYVLPKFDDLYEMLGTQLPLMTEVLITASRWISGNEVVLALIVGGVVAVPIVAWRHPAGKALVDGVLLHAPVVNRLIRNIILAKIFRIWGTLTKSNVPLLEGLRLAEASTKNAQFRAMLDDVIRSVEEGNAVGESLARHSLVPTTMSSPIATGEQSGQLGESLLFLAEYLEEENTQTLAMLTRLVEPLVLIIMGAVVGTIAIALFLPLFDLTAAASGH